MTPQLPVAKAPDPDAPHGTLPGQAMGWRATLGLAVLVLLLLSARWVWLDARADRARATDAELIALVTQQLTLARRAADAAVLAASHTTIEPLSADVATSWHAVHVGTQHDTEQALMLMAQPEVQERGVSPKLAMAMAAWAAAQQRLHERAALVGGSGATVPWPELHNHAAYAATAGHALLAMLTKQAGDALLSDASPAPPALMLALAGVGLLVLVKVKPRSALRHESDPPGAGSARAGDAPSHAPQAEAPMPPAEAEWRRRLARTLAHTARHPQDRFAVVALHLGNPEPALATLGDAAAELLEEAVQRRLLDTLRPTDALWRRAGPELSYLVLLDGLASTEQEQAIVQRLHSEASEAYTVQDHPLQLTLNMGVRSTEPSATDVSQLIGDAELALHVCRELGSAHAVSFSVELGQHHEARRSATARLHQALEGEQFALHFQPVMTLVPARLAGVRAELRWHHPQRGVLSPEQFQADIDDPVCAAMLDEWQLRRAARQFAAWREQCGAAAPAWIGLSLSSCVGAPLAKQLAHVLADTALGASELELRWTEQAFTGDAAAPAGLQALRAMGVRLSLEGLGQASSSLSALSRLPLAAVTVDAHFVHQVQQVEAHRMLVQAIVRMAQTLGIATIADGLQTAAQAQVLHELGVQLGQGEHFASPMATVEFERWMQAQALATV